MIKFSRSLQGVCRHLDGLSPTPYFYCDETSLLENVSKENIPNEGYINAKGYMPSKDCITLICSANTLCTYISTLKLYTVARL